MHCVIYGWSHKANLCSFGEKQNDQSCVGNNIWAAIHLSYRRRQFTSVYWCVQIFTGNMASQERLVLAIVFYDESMVPKPLFLIQAHFQKVSAPRVTSPTLRCHTKVVETCVCQCRIHQHHEHRPRIHTMQMSNLHTSHQLNAMEVVVIADTQLRWLQLFQQVVLWRQTPTVYQW